MAIAPAPISKLSLLLFDVLAWTADTFNVASSFVCPGEAETFWVIVVNPDLEAFSV